MRPESELRPCRDGVVPHRCIVLNKSITLTTFNYLRRGLFEKDKLTVATLVTTRILVDNDLLPGEDVSYLFLGKVVACVESTSESAYLRVDGVGARRSTPSMRSSLLAE